MKNCLLKGRNCLLIIGVIRLIKRCWIGFRRSWLSRMMGGFSRLLRISFLLGFIMFGWNLKILNFLCMLLFVFIFLFRFRMMSKKLKLFMIRALLLFLILCNNHSLDQFLKCSFMEFFLEIGYIVMIKKD